MVVQQDTLIFTGDMDFCITIRTMIKKQNKVYLQAGAGIVADSVPQKEYRGVLQQSHGACKNTCRRRKTYDFAD